MIVIVTSILYIVNELDYKEQKKNINLRGFLGE